MSRERATREVGPRGVGVRAFVATSLTIALAACAGQEATDAPDASSTVSTGAVDAGKHSSHDATTSLGDVIVGKPDGLSIDLDAGVVDAASFVDATLDSAVSAKPGAQKDSAAPACVPTTCAAAGFVCGPLANGCGATIDCGGCTLPDTCSGGGTNGACGCTKATCAGEALSCGTASDGCGGTLSCGSCTFPEMCTSGACATPCGTLVGGSTLASGAHLLSCDSRFSLAMQATDGNLVLYFGSDALWSSKTTGDPGDSATMQTDGNFVVYSSAGTALWQSGTSGNPGAFLVLQSDGNLVLYSAGQAALWSSGTCCH